MLYWLPWWLSDKEPACQCRRPGFDPLCVGKSPWRRALQLTPVFLPGESHGQRSLVRYSLRGLKRVRHNWLTKPPPHGLLREMQKAWNSSKWLHCEVPSQRPAPEMTTQEAKEQLGKEFVQFFLCVFCPHMLPPVAGFVLSLSWSTFKPFSWPHKEVGSQHQLSGEGPRI